MDWISLPKAPVFRASLIADGAIPAWLDLLPQFESDAMAEEVRKKVRAAIAFEEIQEPLLKCRGDLCGSGLCPRCTRVVRRNLIDFGWKHRLSERPWYFVTIRFAGGWRNPGDFTPFGPLNARSDLRAFKASLATAAPDALMMGSIEAVFQTVANRAKGVNLHLHAMVSGADEAVIRRAAEASFELEKIANPLDIQLVKLGERNFLKAWSYSYKQPHWKRSRKDETDRGKRELPSSRQLRQLCANYGPHRPTDRLFTVGFEISGDGIAWGKKGELRVTSLDNVPSGIAGIGTDPQQQVGDGHIQVPAGHSRVTSSNTGEAATHVQPQGGVDPADSNARVLPGAPGARITIVEKIVVEDTGEVLLRLRFPTPSGISETLVPRKMLGDARMFRPHLLALDAAGDIDFKVEADRLLLEAPSNTVIRTTKAGWRGDTYVCELGVFGAAPTERIEFAHSMTPRPRGRAGTVVGHRKIVDDAVRNSDILAITYLAALVPPLMMRVGEVQGFAVHLVGESTTGKTLAQRFGQSVFTSPAETDLLTFDQAPQAISTTISAMAGTAIAFKDLKADSDTGKVHMEKLQRLMFAVHSGDVRYRSKEVALAPPQACVLLLSDEVSLTARFGAQRKATESGTHVRVLEIPVPDRQHGGIFSKIGKRAGKNAAKVLEAGLRNHHGTTFASWIDALVTLSPTRTLVDALGERFIASLGDMDGYDARFARPFGLLAATAHLAKRASLITSKKRFLSALRRVFRKSLAQLHGLTPDVVESIKKLDNAARDTSIFPRAMIGTAINDHKPIGFVRKERGGRFLYIRPESFADFFADGADARGREVLHRAGVIVKPTNGWTASVRQAGLAKEVRCMKLKLSALHTYVARL